MLHFTVIECADACKYLAYILLLHYVHGGKMPGYNLYLVYINIYL